MNEFMQGVQGATSGRGIGFLILFAAALFIAWQNREKLLSFLPKFPGPEPVDTEPDDPDFDGFHERLEAYRMVFLHCERVASDDVCQLLNEKVLPHLISGDATDGKNAKL